LKDGSGHGSEEGGYPNQVGPKRTFPKCETKKKLKKAYGENKRKKQAHDSGGKKRSEGGKGAGAGKAKKSLGRTVNT